MTVFNIALGMGGEFWRLDLQKKLA